MAYKRTATYAGKSYAVNKRRRTLGTQVQTLSRQVNANKKELKYFDLAMITPGTATTYKSLFTQAELPIPQFIGRCFHLRKIRVSLSSTADELQMYAEKKTSNAKLPTPATALATRYDPEYHTILRDWKASRDSSDPALRGKEFTLTFGRNGRLVEYDNQTSGVAVGPITKGDIQLWASGDPTQEITSVRFWYTDA